MIRRYMGRKGVLIGFWLGGFVIGAFAWLVRAPVVQFIENLGLDAVMAQEMIAGLFGSVVMVLSVVFWSFLTSK